MIYTAKVKTLKVVFQCSLRYLRDVGCVDHICCAARSGVYPFFERESAFHPDK